MTAYGACISLSNRIDYILQSSRISLIEPSPDIIRPAYEELEPLREILERLDKTSKSKSRKKVNALDGRIKDTLWEFEDSLDSLLTNQIPSSLRISEDLHGEEYRGERKRKRKKRKISRGERDEMLFSIDLRCLQDDVASFVHTLKDMKREYIYELDNMPEDEDESSPTRIGFRGSTSKMIGLSDQFIQIKRKLMSGYSRSHVYTLVGTPGVGKTTIAEKIFEDPEILNYFDHRAWVKVGRKYQISQLSQVIVAQLCGTALTEGAKIIGNNRFLRQSLESERCLIVLDDVWEAVVVPYLLRSLPRIESSFFQFLVTSRERHLYKFGFWLFDSDLPDFMVVRFLNEEESKDLLCDKVFGDGICPDQLDKAATKIAKNCEGLPLMILTVADHLSNRDPEYWNDVAEMRNSVFLDSYNQISEVLFPSYDYLPQYLKMYFLFMGVFPREYETPPSKIINMLTSEGWLVHLKIEPFTVNAVWHCLDELCAYRNLALFKKKSTYWKEKSLIIRMRESNFTSIRDHDQIFRKRIFKTCWLHSSWRHVCRGEARKNKFYHVLNRLVDGEEEDVKGQRCLCLENNMLFGIKEFCDSVRLNCPSSTRSLLFFGPYHQYPIPIDASFRLLGKLDALKLRLFSFPEAILKLIQLKYLALTCNGEVPTTISNLFNLAVLIIHPHMDIRCLKAPSYVPVQIWDMQELEHIEILGKSLVAPSHVASLEKLSTLVGVNASICTVLELSKRIPNIEKLGIQIVLTPYDDHSDLLRCFRCISKLERLDTVKYSIINPVLQYGYVIPMTPRSLMFPSRLRKLHLSGMGFPWEYMDVVGSLPCLQVLKLRSYAFRGSKWEDTDLVQWKPRRRSFCRLTYLSLKHCYKLQEFDWPSMSVKVKIDIVDCNPLVLTLAKQLKVKYNAVLNVTATSHFDGKPQIIEFQRSSTSNEVEEDKPWLTWKDYDGMEEESSHCLSSISDEVEEESSHRLPQFLSQISHCPSYRSNEVEEESSHRLPQFLSQISHCPSSTSDEVEEESSDEEDSGFIGILKKMTVGLCCWSSATSKKDSGFLGMLKKMTVGSCCWSSATSKKDSGFLGMLKKMTVGSCCWSSATSKSER